MEEKILEKCRKIVSPKMWEPWSSWMVNLKSCLQIWPVSGVLNFYWTVHSRGCLQTKLGKLERAAKKNFVKPQIHVMVHPPSLQIICEHLCYKQTFAGRCQWRHKMALVPLFWNWDVGHGIFNVLVPVVYGINEVRQHGRCIQSFLWKPAL